MQYVTHRNNKILIDVVIKACYPFSRCANKGKRVPMITPDLPLGEYHSHSAISKSGLWSLYTKTPSHYQYANVKGSKAKDLGSATHIAVLEPHRFETLVIKGPDDRRGNKWKDVAEEAAAYGRIALTSGDYESALCMRDSTQMLPELRRLTDGEQVIEASGFWIDPQTGLECRCRPDIYHPGLAIMADLKTTGDAGAWAWARTAANMGYHLQEAMYSEGWPLAGGGEVGGFLFITVEDEPPYAAAIYELKPSAVLEGREVMGKALRLYAQCKQADVWPGYPGGVQELDIPRYAYRETVPEYID